MQPRARTRAHILVLRLYLHISPLLQPSYSFLSSWSQMPCVGFFSSWTPPALSKQVQGPHKLTGTCFQEERVLTVAPRDSVKCVCVCGGGMGGDGAAASRASQPFTEAESFTPKSIHPTDLHFRGPRGLACCHHSLAVKQASCKYGHLGTNPPASALCWSPQTVPPPPPADSS